MTATTTTVPPYPVRRFWNAAYVAGCRVTFDAGTFAFHRAELPLVRIQRAGNAFGVFSALEPTDPEPWILDGIEEHNGVLVAWLSQSWPAQLERFAWHMLVEDHEFTPLIWHARSIGHKVSGWAGVGGWIPNYVGKQPAQPMSPNAYAGLPPILADWKGVRL